MKKISSKPAILGIILGAVLIISAGTLYLISGSSGDDEIVWDLTLVGSHQEQMVLSYQDIRDMPHEKARGGFFTTVGVVNGPYEVEGVPLLDLCRLVGGMTADDVVAISAADGYSMVFNLEQVNGDIETYDPATLHEVPNDGLKMLLIYKLDGKTLSDVDGQPLRLAVVGNADLLTEGHNWVKWVNRIEVVHLE